MTQTQEKTAEDKLGDWIEDNLDCEVLSIERQERWRPSWYMDVRMRDGAQRALYLRGSRTGSLDPRFEMECELFKVLEAEGIPVPHSYGLCPDPMGIVMDRAEGRADLSTAESDEERASVLNQYIEALARIHSIDPAKFDDVISLPRPQEDGHIGLAQFENSVTSFRKTKRRAEPVLEFLIGWVRRNAPSGRTEKAFLVCDPAQFMFEDGRLTAVLDLEMAYIGDPLHDLAALQLRDTSEPLGKLAPALRHYEEVTGKPIDPEVFDFYAIAWSICTPVQMTDGLTQGLPTGNVLQYLEWWVTFCRVPLELIAACRGIELRAPPAIAGEPSPFAHMSKSLVGAIGAIPVEGGFAEYERASTANLAAYLERAAEFGPGIMRQDIAEIEELLGSSFDSWQTADAALEAFVLAAGPEEDERLIQLLYNRSHRQCQLFAPFLSRPSVGMTLETYSQLMAG